MVNDSLMVWKIPINKLSSFTKYNLIKELVKAGLHMKKLQKLTKENQILHNQ